MPSLLMAIIYAEGNVTTGTGNAHGVYGEINIAFTAH